MIQLLGKFTCVSKLYLSMGSYHFLLDYLAKQLTTVNSP